MKREWPKNWESFISDIVGASKTNESLCQNNMAILKLLSEEVFDFSSGQMTQTKAKHLKDTMCSEFSQIFQLCQFVMDNSQNVPLVAVTLETLLRFLNWIPLGYIFETKLITTLIFKVKRVCCTSLFFFPSLIYLFRDMFRASILYILFNIIFISNIFAVFECTNISEYYSQVFDRNRGR